MKFPDISLLYSLFGEFPVITTDSRKAVRGTIFFALKGDNFNGNQFAQLAIQQGCTYAVIDEEQYYSGEQCILVKDVLAALQDLASFHREHLKIPFIAITGSNGKTTTKELVKNILSLKYKVRATEGNLNNHIGVPLTLLSISNDTEIAIIEMGANHIGEIARLCEIARPDYGLITNIGRAHIGEFGSFEAIVQAKTELYEFLGQKDGKVFIHSTNELLMSAAPGVEKITYGNLEDDFCSCKFLESDPFVKIEYENEIISTQLIGRYNFENIVAAICIGKYFGVADKKIKEALEEYVPSNNRSQVVRTEKNTLILDAYNANPSSMRAAIENFEAMKGESKWLLLGDMLELGKYEGEEHKAILQLICDKKFRNVILVGQRFEKAASEMKNNIPALLLYKNSEELVNYLKTHPISGPSIILVKGSRGIKLEKAVEFL